MAINKQQRLLNTMRELRDKWIAAHPTYTIRIVRFTGNVITIEYIDTEYNHLAHTITA